MKQQINSDNNSELLVSIKRNDFEKFKNICNNSKAKTFRIKNVWKETIVHLIIYYGDIRYLEYLKSFHPKLIKWNDRDWEGKTDKQKAIELDKFDLLDFLLTK